MRQGCRRSAPLLMKGPSTMKVRSILSTSCPRVRPVLAPRLVCGAIVMGSGAQARHLGRGAVASLSALLFVAALTPLASWAQSSVHTAATDPPIFDTEAHAAFRWAMPKRWGASWDAYDPDTHTYDPDFVRATQGWRLDLTVAHQRLYTPSRAISSR